MLATRDTIVRYIPQRDPIVMIHNLVETGDDFAHTQFLIEANTLFVAGGVLAEPGLVENMAQTAAAHVGYQCLAKNIPVPIGYIAAVKDLVILKCPNLNSLIETHVRIVNQVMNITIIHGEVKQDGMMIASCEMKIFVQQS